MISAGGLFPAWNEMAVGAEDHGRVLAAGDGDDIHADGDELGGDVVPEVVEPHGKAHPIAQVVATSGHGARVDRGGVSDVGAEDERVIDALDAARQGSFLLGLVLFAEKVEVSRSSET
jgi:hypothetical protein